MQVVQQFSHDRIVVEAIIGARPPGAYMKSKSASEKSSEVSRYLVLWGLLASPIGRDLDTVQRDYSTALTR